MLTHRALPLFFALFLWGGRAALAEQVVWEPHKTRAVIVGVLAWQDPSIGTFAKEDRKDRELYDTLRKRGVPAQNMTLLLDEQATRQAVLDALSAQLAGTREGDTFLFYYAGHGVLRGNRAVFVPYDFGPEKGLGMAEISGLMTSELKGERALLFADCCYSGALEKVANDLQATGIQAASLTSATARLPSVSNWTFTQILVDCLAGQAAADRDGNLAITMAETATEVADAMRFHEVQQNGVTTRDWFDDLVLSTAPPLDRTLKKPFSLFDYVAIEHEGRREMGRLAGLQEGKFVVEIQAYSERIPVEVPPVNIKPLPSTPSAVAADAEIIASVGGKYSELLRTIEVEPDYLEYTEFHDYGFQEECGYRGYESLPESYWVYVYPNWYLWAEARKP